MNVNIFPHHNQQQAPSLASVIESQSSTLVIQAVSSMLQAGHTEEYTLEKTLREEKVEPIKIGNKIFTGNTWVRTLTAGGDFEISRHDFMHGQRPGQDFQTTYQIYELEVLSGAEYLKTQNAGGKPIDSEFVEFNGEGIVIRAHTSEFRDELIEIIEFHINKANQTIEQWNRDDFPAMVRKEIARQVNEQASEDRKHKALIADGFQVIGQQPRVVPLPDQKKRIQSRAKNSGPEQTSDGVPRALLDSQFSDILDAIATHKNNVERTRGAGAKPGDIEDLHRDSLLAALNMRFQEGTAESFSKNGKTDIRLVHSDNSVFYAECKIWRGQKTVTEALTQLLELYLTYSDRHGALIFFVRNIKNPEDLPSKAISHLEEQHSAVREADEHRFPVVGVSHPATNRKVRLAIVFIVVDSSA